MKPLVIGLYSPAPQSGKTTIARILEAEDYSIISFATPLKRMTAQFLVGFGYSQAEANSMITQKELIVKELGVTIRHLMQTIGTEWGRNTIDKDVWIKAWKAKAERSLLVVVDDVRFPNEAEAVKSMGGEVWKIIRPSAARTETHSSEGQLDDWDGFDGVIINDKGLEELRGSVYEGLGYAPR